MLCQAGGVTIKTPDETLTGDSGYYNAKTNTAEVKGNVKIIRGPNTLEGARAKLNMTTKCQQNVCCTRKRKTC